MKRNSSPFWPHREQSKSLMAGALLVPLLLLGCGNFAEHPNSTPGQADRERLEDVCIELDRGPCYGSCPSYSVTIEGNGRVTFVGRDYVSEVGRRETQISEDSVRDLLRAFEDARFFELEDSYWQQVTCLSLETITLYVGGRSKRVHNYGLRRRFDLQGHELKDWQAQESLFALADAIDAAARTELWIKAPHEIAVEDSATEGPSARR
jgi:hypothetical protein